MTNYLKIIIIVFASALTNNDYLQLLLRMYLASHAPKEYLYSETDSRSNFD